MNPKAKNKGVKPKKVTGTNKYDIDESQVEKLAQRFWKMTEIAAFFNVDEGTIRKRFPNLITKGKELGKGKLRDLQLAAAMKGNATMLVWLGKQYLDQKEPDQQMQDMPLSLPEFENMTSDELKIKLEEKLKKYKDIYK